MIACPGSGPHSEPFTVRFAAGKTFYDSRFLMKADDDKGSIWYPFVVAWSADASGGCIA